MMNDEILREFLLETHENLALLDSDLIALEKNPTEKSTLGQVFRTLHSVKGTAGFMGLVKLEAVAHSAESLLSKLRSGEMQFNPTIATVMLRVVDAIREILASIEASGEEGTGEYSALIAEVDRLRESGQHSAPATTRPEPIKVADEPDFDQTRVDEPLILPPPASETSPAPQPSRAPQPQPAPITAPSQSPAPTSTSETLVVSPSELTRETKGANVADTSIRVDVGLLDKLMTLVGELVLARNQILKYSDLHDDDAFLGPVQRLNQLTTELQASVMKTRLQPIGNVLGKFPRIVRDLALACGKRVSFEMDGQDTELDKSLIEAIRDPLTHMVRNAIDHGIELPKTRTLRGKPEEGRLRMVAFHQGGKVVIEISDDGEGIDEDRVRDKAIRAKLVSPEAMSRMSRQEVLRLIFQPGFSTADRVTQFSGRGVGMDVVRTNIEKIGGTVDVESTRGQGTTIRTQIPLTLAIIPALIIEIGGQGFAIPQMSLLELVYLEPDQAQRGIERIHGAPVYRLRGKLLPLVFLNEQLQVPATRAATDDLHIVVVQADDQPFGLIVDAIRDTEEIVVKPLQQQLKEISVFNGAAILGDGRVALVLDVLGLAHRSNVLRGVKSRGVVEYDRPTTTVAEAGQALLLFASRTGGQMAMPLSQVARLEELPRSAFEAFGAREVVQYRGEILPLIDVSRQLESVGGRRVEPMRKRPDEDAADIVSVVVYADGERRAGLIVDRILDIVQDQVTARSQANRPGVLFTAMVQERVTEFIDVAALVRDATTDLPSATV